MPRRKSPDSKPPLREEGKGGSMLEEEGLAEEMAQFFPEVIERRKKAENATEGQREDAFVEAFNRACDNARDPFAFLRSEQEDIENDR